MTRWKDSWHRFHHPPKSILIVNKLRTQPVILAIDAFLESVYPALHRSPFILIVSPHLDTSIQHIPVFVSSTKIDPTSHTGPKYGILVAFVLPSYKL